MAQIPGSLGPLVSGTEAPPTFASEVQRPHPPLRVSLRELLSTVHHFRASRSSSKEKSMELPGSPGTSNSWHLLLFCSYETSLSLKSVTT
ncbi:hypothetical protein XELAEV_18003026mg [Xenopus laevis]|uniref:Uncharacterized protein n=1 Tax=Xenopus laevis TaxID=8355 RepID=A0A974BNB6_XENLA|nr:hypothetical protein XELAEV_18003026mg [Xenopus laevis]